MEYEQPKLLGNKCVDLCTLSSPAGWIQLTRSPETGKEGWVRRQKRKGV